MVAGSTSECGTSSLLSNATYNMQVKNVSLATAGALAPSRPLKLLNVFHTPLAAEFSNLGSRVSNDNSFGGQYPLATARPHFFFRLPLCEAMRSCQKRRCGGPQAHSFNVTCDRGNDRPFAVDWLVRHFGSQVAVPRWELLMSTTEGCAAIVVLMCCHVADLHPPSEQVRGLLKDGAAGVNRHLNAPGELICCDDRWAKQMPWETTQM